MSAADPLSVACPDCTAPAGTGCYTSNPVLDPTHAERRRIADLRALEHGTCALCGQAMVYGSVEGSPVDAWHPDETDAAACPPIPDPRTNWNRYAEAVNAGLTPGHPGVQHFLPAVPLTPEDLAIAQQGILRAASTDPICPECRSGKHPNCDGQAWDPTTDAPTTCACADAHHPGDPS